MTHQLDVARGRDTLTRWCALAEARLEHLTELFETGRWRRYHSEVSFLENIQEAKSAVLVWRDLASREASRDNSAVDVSWLGRAATTASRGGSLPGRIDRPQPRPVKIEAEPPASVISIVPVAGDPGLDLSSLPATADASELARDIAAAVSERYPQLRNAM
jgi:uncharacterized repeat protein (TIGR03809 family)